MTQHGIEIGIPTLAHIERYVAEKRLYAKANEIFAYWEMRNWLTKKGEQVKTVEAACNVYNSFAVQDARSKGLIPKKSE